MASPPILSPAEPIVDRYRRLTEKWYPWFKKLIDSLRTAEAAIEDQGAQITEIREVTDGLGARWGISISINNQVVGLVRLDGNAIESTFTVVADKFIIAHPTAAGDTIQAFVAGLVDGVPTVGINGAVVIDGTILARHIVVATLDAIAANIGTITAGRLQRADGTMVVDLDNKRILIQS